MGWLALLAIGCATAAALLLLRLPRLVWMLAGSALMLGATGYAVQGMPGQPGAPAATMHKGEAIDPALIALREKMFGRFNAEQAYFVAADALEGDGSPGQAAQFLLAGVRALKSDSALWTGAGGAIAAQDGGQVSPAALLAFRQAMALAPAHPGPPFFLGLAYVRAGQFGEAEHWWRRALALAPQGSPVRPEILDRLTLLRLLMARMQANDANGH